MDLGPGADDHLDPEDLDDLRARVVLPVVTSLLTADELVSADVVRRRGTPPLTAADMPAGTGVYVSFLDITYAPDAADSHVEDGSDGRTADEVWVVLEARGDEHGEWLLHSACLPEPWTLGDAAVQLADQMADRVCETRFAWGQRREPEITVPKRDASGPYSPS